MNKDFYFRGSRVFIFEKFFPLGANLGGASWDLAPQKHPHSYASETERCIPQFS